MTRRVVLGAVVALVAAAPAPAADRVLNIAHQGGEVELPSNTMYAFKRALHGGADTLELDVSSTADGQLVVMHDWRVDRTTNGSGYLTDLTLDQVRALDAAYNFVPGRNAVPRLPASRYPLRGIRTGQRRPPRGFTREAFRVPALAEVMRAFPRTPINIEIKGRDDRPEQFARNAELLAGVLRSTRRTDLIVTSFNQPALDRFHALAPSVALAPGVDGIARFLLRGESAGPGVVALQIPITFPFGGSTVEVTTPDSVLRAHRAGYAVHVWLSNDEENARVYDRLLDMCVDGIMAARPLALERRLKARDVVRPNGRGTDPCGVRATGASVNGGSVTVTLARRGLGMQAHSGTVTLRGAGRTLARGGFSLPEGETSARQLALRLSRAGRAALRTRRRVRAVVDVRTRGARGEPVATRVVLRR